MCLCPSAHAAYGFRFLTEACLCMASEYCCLHRHPAPCASVICSCC
ncbi:unnamed protein product [Staurois parvus]|uniref:Uncharacterized protein n=1 Tax=Staurois parvus TaxID=386267 RepID=A0ABN9DCM7_9NEOB|nr:unnamed protein product [Staurois parvus]